MKLAILTLQMIFFSNMYLHSSTLYYHCTLKQPGTGNAALCDVTNTLSPTPSSSIWSHLRAQSGPYLQDAFMFAGDKYSVFL